MKTVLLYKPNSEHDTKVGDFVRDVKMQTGKDVPIMDADSPEGIDFAQLYDIMQFPAIVVTDEEGHVQNVWQGDQFPLINELSYYLPDNRKPIQTSPTAKKVK